MTWQRNMRPNHSDFPFPKPRPNKKHLKRKRKRIKDVPMVETDKKYILTRIYADINMDEYLTPIAWSALRRLYEGHEETVKIAFDKDPLFATQTILPRLQRKYEEWKGEREEMRRVYRDVATRNSYKALDWQPKYKRLDKTRLNHSEIWRELITGQSVLNPEFSVIIENRRVKRSTLKEKDRQQFNEQSSPLEGSSSIKPTRLVNQHYVEKSNINSSKSRQNGFKEGVNKEMNGHSEHEEMKSNAMKPTQDTGHKDYGIDLSMKVYYNYGLRFSLNDTAGKLNKPPLAPPDSIHINCWNASYGPFYII